MEPEVIAVLKRLELEDADEREAEETGAADVPMDDRMYTLHPDSSQLLHIMIQASGSKRIVELGVAHGYSTIWLAHAARITGGRVTSLEINPRAIELASKNLDEAGLADYVDFVLGDARETLRSLEGPIDFMLFDCWEWLYVECLDLTVPLLRPGGLLVADNVTAGEPGVAEYLDALREHPLMETVSVPIGRDLEVSGKKLSA